MIPRTILEEIKKSIFRGKTILLFGPRQYSKTTLLEMLSNEIEEKVLILDCDEPDIRRELSETTSTQLKQIIGRAKVVMIDEAQRVRNIGITLKLIHDKIKDVQLIVTGSSSLELTGEINEPLTGRKIEFLLLPLSTQEMIGFSDVTTEKRLLKQRLLFGLYPGVINETGNERKTLNNLSGSYLYKDIFTFQDIRKPEIIETLLEALALQIGSEVSYTELANILGIDQLTVRRYIDLLEKSFVLFRLRSFSRNVRNEIKKSRKIYFFDNGIRNSIISNFADIDLRTDKGALWENYLVSERYKLLNNRQVDVKRYFWRTTQQQEIDYIEERDGRISAYEFKWQTTSKKKLPRTFIAAYPNSFTSVIHTGNYFDFLAQNK
ncbi:MAG: ATP-binding protein [Bacteroidales bacterium]|nr:ATP-binding protein [Bacteroidales bacterium]